MSRTRLGDTANFLVITAVAVSLAGCMTVWRRLDVPPRVDLSTTAQTAVVRGSQSGLNGLDCFVSEPARARALTVDAGDQTLVASCYSWGGEAGTSLRMSGASLTFEALPGHDYAIVGYSTCLGCGKRTELGYEHVDLVDVTDEDRVIVRQRLSGARRPGGRRPAPEERPR